MSTPGRDAREENELREEVRRAVAAANSTVSRSESIRVFRVLPEPFDLANGMLTPSMKLRRDAIARRYAAEIEAMYADVARGPPAAPPRRRPPAGTTRTPTTCSAAPGADDETRRSPPRRSTTLPRTSNNRTDRNRGTVSGRYGAEKAAHHGGGAGRRAVSVRRGGTPTGDPTERCGWAVRRLAVRGVRVARRRRVEVQRVLPGRRRLLPHPRGRGGHHVRDEAHRAGARLRGRRVVDHGRRAGQRRLAVPGRDRAGVPGRGRVERAVRAPAAEGGADRAGPRLTGPARCPTDLTTGRAVVDERVLRMRRCSGRKWETTARQPSAPP